MSKERYVSYEVAKLLKQKGFCEENIYCYYQGEYENDSIDVWRGECKFNWNIYDDSYSAPTQQMAMAWLRDKQIDILPDCSLVDRKYSFHIINRYKSGGEIIHSDEVYDKYEDAIETALQYCLTNLI